VQLDDENRKALYVGEGLGHAFVALDDGTVVQYLCSTGYAPEREHGVHPLDPDIGIEWPTVGRDGSALEHLLSARDREMPSLHEAERSGLLPAYDEVQAYVAELRV
jgi:dTDP-4-dehydrorhamnose 3,5-epimerase